MTRTERLNDTEELVLLVLARLDGSGYGVTIQQEIEDRGGRSISIAAVYATLDRLEKRGLAGSRHSEPTPERGGRAKRYFRLTREGAHALVEARKIRERLWSGLDPQALETHA